MVVQRKGRHILMSDRKSKAVYNLERSCTNENTVSLSRTAFIDWMAVSSPTNRRASPEISTFANVECMLE